MDLRHRGGAFADRAADALDRARAHVADREHAAHARFERRGAVAPARAARRAVNTKPCASSATSQPSSQAVSGSAPTNRNTWRSGALVLGAAAPVAPCRAGEAARRIAVEPRQLGVRQQLDVRRGARCGRSGSATCSPRGSARAPA